MYMLEEQEMSLTLIAKSTLNVCGHELTLTEHPRFIIYERKENSLFVDEEVKSSEDLDIFAYVNSKFIYAERHIKSQIRNMYHRILENRCNLKREVIKNSLLIAVISPDEFAYSLIKGPGYMSVTAGEVVHIVKCLPVEVIIEHGESCYNQLQVSRNNETWFMTHILIKRGFKNCFHLTTRCMKFGIKFTSLHHTIPNEK